MANLSKVFQEQKELIDLKSDIYQILAGINDVQLLRKVKKTLFPKSEEIDQNKKIVAYTSEGRPITKYEMELSFLECQEQIKRGEVISLEDLEKESENW